MIDEISMLSAEIFDMLSKIGTRVRANDRPFGGLQIVLCGDFFQLPPVGLGASTNLCFKAKTWQALFHATENNSENRSLFVLDKVFRQKDSEFLRMLHEIRRGDISNDTKKCLTKKVADDYQRERARKMLLQDSDSLSQLSSSEKALKTMKPTRLFGKNVDVERINREELQQIDAKEYSFQAHDEGSEKYLNQLRNSTKFPELITLKVGAEVERSV